MSDIIPFMFKTQKVRVAKKEDEFTKYVSIFDHPETEKAA
jgi:hypothetical protein